MKIKTHLYRIKEEKRKIDTVQQYACDHTGGDRHSHKTQTPNTPLALSQRIKHPIVFALALYSIINKAIEQRIYNMLELATITSPKPSRASILCYTL